MSLVQAVVAIAIALLFVGFVVKQSFVVVEAVTASFAFAASEP